MVQECYPPKNKLILHPLPRQDKQSSIDFDRYLVLRQQDQLIGWIDGDEEDPDSRFKSSNYTFQPYLQRNGITWLFWAKVPALNIL